MNTAMRADYVGEEKYAVRYRWLKENSAKFSWKPSRYNERIVDGFAAFGTGYLGYNFEQAVDLAMQAALAAAKGDGS
jgi:hypothetical protein